MNHDHHHDVAGSLTFNEKMIKLLEHWIKHNHEHSENYKKWAHEAGKNIDTHMSMLLDDAADLTLSINKKFEEALRLLNGIEK